MEGAPFIGSWLVAICCLKGLLSLPNKYQTGLLKRSLTTFGSFQRSLFRRCIFGRSLACFCTFLHDNKKVGLPSFP